MKTIFIHGLLFHIYDMYVADNIVEASIFDDLYNYCNIKLAQRLGANRF